MLRLSLRLTTTLLWLAIALLPLRGWAAATMHLAQGNAPVSVMQHADSGHAAATGSPCHAADHDTASGNAPACSLCDLCHAGTAAAPPRAPTLLPVLPHAAPRVASAPEIERPVHDGPERPPRIVLA